MALINDPIVAKPPHTRQGFSAPTSEPVYGRREGPPQSGREYLVVFLNQTNHYLDNGFPHHVDSRTASLPVGAAYTINHPEHDRVSLVLFAPGHFQRN